MKKWFLLSFLFFIAGFTFAQSFISNYLSYLGKPVPNDFCRINDTIYTNNNVILSVENNIVISSGWTEEYDNYNEAEFHYKYYCNLFINTGWTLFEDDLFSNLYKFSNIYVECSIGYRIGGIPIIMIILCSEENYKTLWERRLGG
jgi:predicted membrane metal-binding protein